jgi:Fe-S-cluster containining protein
MGKNRTANARASDQPSGTGPRYLCQRCGHCCRWPGFVRVDEKEIAAIAEFLGLSADDFIERHTDLRPSRSGLMLKSNPDGSCIFLEGVNTCTIQPVKPQQCRDFPNKWRFEGWREKCEAIDVMEAML